MPLRKIQEELFRLRDEQYRDFQIRLIPTVDPQTVIGVRTPLLRQYAKELSGREEADVFLSALPHRYFDENQLHAFLLCEMKDYERCVGEVCRFLPYVNNWATCDQLSPKVFRKHRAELLKPVGQWLSSPETYTVRFGIGMLMQHYLDADFDSSYPQRVAAIRSQEYYVNMMIAWYFATALAKQYDAALPFLESRCLDPWTHNKAIQKAIESYRIAPERKEHLKGLKIPSKRK